MTTQAIAQPARGQILQNFRLAGPVLGIGLLVLGLLFHEEVAAAVDVWMASTAYNHCLLIIPIVAYLLWDRRALLVAMSPIPTPWPALLAVPVVMVWFLAERLGIMEGRQLMAMTLVEILFLCVLGLRLWYALLGPLLYLYFLVPFGAFVEPSLQNFTTSFIVHGLNLLNIPNYSDGYMIEIPEGAFQVAEACAGLRFLIASIAFGCLYALLVYRSPLRRGLFILASMVIPIIANGFRALGIVVLGHLIGNAQAATADHIIYGWIFFSIVILIEIAVGLPFREDHRAWLPPGDGSIQPAASGGHNPLFDRGIRRRRQAWYRRLLANAQLLLSEIMDRTAGQPARRATLSRLAIAAAVPILLAAIGPASAAVLERVNNGALPARLPILTFLGPCRNDPISLPKQEAGPGWVNVQHLVCGDAKFVVRTIVLPPSVSPGNLIRALRAASGEEGAEVAASGLVTPSAGSGTWQVVETSSPANVVASSLWIDGKSARVSFNLRVKLALASITGSAYAPVIVSITPVLDWSKYTVAQRNHARDLITAFLQSYPSLSDQIARLSRAAVVQ
jgi:exosortase A